MERQCGQEGAADRDQQHAQRQQRADVDDPLKAVLESEETAQQVKADIGGEAVGRSEDQGVRQASALE